MISKVRLSIRLNAPYKEEKRKAASKVAREHVLVNQIKSRNSDFMFTKQDVFVIVFLVSFGLYGVRNNGLKV